MPASRHHTLANLTLKPASVHANGQPASQRRLRVEENFPPDPRLMVPFTPKWPAPGSMLGRKLTRFLHRKETAPAEDKGTVKASRD